MLQAMLHIIAAHGTASVAELARRLDIDRPLTQTLLDELTRLGYLRRIVRECRVPCEHCPLHTACLFNKGARIWALSGKAERLLRRQGE